MRIESLRLRSPAPEALAEFYRSAFDAELTREGVALGEERIEILPSAPDETEAFAANETGFQHFAIVVADMDAAFARLQAVTGWRPISLRGPERLPKASGGAVAFKFRDPDGHPLELLQLPPADTPAIWSARFAASPRRLFFGVDHTAITVHDAEASRAFYEALGFAAGPRQLNQGLEQAKLDGLVDIQDVRVTIIPLTSGDGSRPGVELLQYAQPETVERTAGDASAMATSIVVAGVAADRVSERDLDGHRLACAAIR